MLTTNVGEESAVQKTVSPLKLNLGSGYQRLPQFVNVDKYADADLKLDLEITPWPWADSSVDEVLMSHVLEHLGASVDVYFKIMKELYRVCKPNALIQIRVPHPRHDDFLTDPTHVRPVTGQSLSMFSKRLNHLWIEAGAANSTLGIYLDIDFELLKCDHVLGEPWNSEFQSGKISEAEIQQAIREKFNVVKELNIVLKVIK